MLKRLLTPRHPMRSFLAFVALSFSLAPCVQASDHPASPNAAGPEANTTATPPMPLDELRNFAEVFERIRSAYVEEVDDETLFSYAIQGMLSSLDPHSSYLQPQDFNDLQENTSGEFGGLGIEIGQQDGLILVVSPIDDTPAERAGIQPGDLIVTLDGKSVMGMSITEAVENMRGEPGSTIHLEVRRDGEAELLDFELERAVVKVASVRSDLLSSDIGYLRITQFQAHTGKELVKKLRRWKEDGNLNGIVLDLRNNPGGVLGAAVDVSNAFLDSGLIVYTEGRAVDSELRYKATPETAAADVPVVVLINGGSASASEIVAGALQDHHRAVILGTRSFGKGSVQSVLPLANDKAVKLTTARYFTPSGRSIQAQGIEPDIVVAQSDVTPRKRVRRLKEADLQGHLSNPEDADANRDDKRAGPDELLQRDFQLYEAHTLLRGMTIVRSGLGNEG